MTPTDVPVVDIDLVALESDPMRHWAMLRAEAPVAFVPQLGAVVATRHDDVKRVSRDDTAFSAAVAAPLARTIGPNFMYADGEQHRRLRSVVTPLLKPSLMEPALGSWIDMRVEQLLGELPANEPVDLMRAFAEPLAAGVLRQIVGLDGVTDDELRRWFRAIATGAANFERDPEKDVAAAAVMRELDGVLTDAYAAGVRTETLLGQFVERPRAELLGAVGLFLIGGLQEPRDLLGLVLLGILTDRAQLCVLLNGPDRDQALSLAIEEACRWGSPVGTVTRVASFDVEMSGQLVPAGSLVAGVLASANRDERRWTDPDRFHVSRREGPHLAFGSGAHACVGAAAARLVVRAALGGLLSTYPGVRLVEEPDVVGYEFRGPATLMVSLDS